MNAVSVRPDQPELFHAGGGGSIFRTVAEFARIRARHPDITPKSGDFGYIRPQKSVAKLQKSFACASGLYQCFDGAPAADTFLAGSGAVAGAPSIRIALRPLRQPGDAENFSTPSMQTEIGV